jgi:hypothetical protein
MAVQIAADLQLSAQQRGLMVATPILAGALLRFAMGMLVDRLSPKTAGLIGQVIVIVALACAWHLGIHSFEQVLLLGVFLGVAGASFAVSLPLASQWYPPAPGQGHGHRRRRQLRHRVRRAAGAGAGRGLRLEQRVRFRPDATVADPGAVRLAGPQRPERPKPKAMADYLKALGDRDSWWFMFFYSVTFGGFIGLASALPGYFNDQYGLSPVTAGYYTAACVFAGSLMRPLGGALADRFGGIRTLLGMYSVAAMYWRRRLQPAQRRRRTGPVRLRHARPGRRQWRGVPAGAAALSPGDRRDDRADRHGRRHRRLPAGGRPGHDQAAHRQLPDGPVAVRQPGPAGLVRPARRQAALAHHLGLGGRDCCAGLR